jgi:hypothetical protein
MHELIVKFSGDLACFIKLAADGQAAVIAGVKKDPLRNSSMVLGKIPKYWGILLWLELLGLKLPNDFYRIKKPSSASFAGLCSDVFDSKLRWSQNPVRFRPNPGQCQYHS